VPTDKELTALGDAVPAGTTPIRVQYIAANQPEGKAAKQAGLKEGDVILAVDGQPLTMTPKAFQMHVRLDHKPGDKLNLRVLRNGKPVEIAITLVE
jgi:S1-C subfamily serine protease